MRLSMLFLCALFVCAPVWAADTAIQLQFEEIEFLQSSASITEAAPIAMSNADKQSDGLLVGGDGNTRAGRLYLGLYYDVDMGTATSISIKIQVSPDNSTWVDVLPSNAFTVTADEVAVRAVSIPPCKYIRVYISKDAADGTAEVDILKLWRM